MDDLAPVDESGREMKSGRGKGKAKNREVETLDLGDYDNPLFPENSTGDQWEDELDSGGGLLSTPRTEMDEKMLEAQRDANLQKGEVMIEGAAEKYHQKKNGAKAFLGLQVFFIVVGIMDFSFGLSVANASYYGHDVSMAIFVGVGLFLIAIGAFGIAGVFRMKTLLPFHFFLTVVASIFLFYLTIFTLMREEAVNHYIDENWEDMNDAKDKQMTRDEMKAGADTVMTLLSVVGMLTVVMFILSEMLILWLFGPTRTLGTVLVAVDATFISGGMMLICLGINASAETHAYSQATIWAVKSAFFLGVLCMIMGVLFGIIKHQASQEGVSVFEEHRLKSVAFAGMIAFEVLFLFILAIFSAYSYTVVDDTVQAEWGTEDFKRIRREYTSHSAAADALRGNILELSLGYYGLLTWLIHALAGVFYIFKQHKLEKLQELKAERTRKRSVGRDHLKRKQGGMKNFAIALTMICLVFLFEVSWLASSRQFGCPGEKALAKLKVSMLDGLDNRTLVVIQTNIEDKVDETAIPYRLNHTIAMKVKCVIETTTKEDIDIEYRIYAYEFGMDHLVYQTDRVAKISDNYESYFLLPYKEFEHYHGDAHLEVRASYCRTKLITRFLVHIDFS